MHGIQPPADHVFPRASEREEVILSGIVLPDASREKPREGVVGRPNDEGERVSTEVKVGDAVLYARHAGTEVKIAGEDLLILEECDVPAIVE
jgi:chaperonin GroES